MKATVLLLAILSAVTFCCSCEHAAVQAKGDWLYLGIPADEEYPDTRFQLDSYVPHKYWRVSRVRHVTGAEFESDVASAHMLFRDKHAGTQYYATESRGDFDRQGDTRYWVTILERKAYP